MQGAETALSGLLTLLGVAEILGNSSAPGAFQRRIVFAALAGEPWGYMGSRRLLWAMQQSHASVAGLPFHHIDQASLKKACPRPACCCSCPSHALTLILFFPWAAATQGTVRDVSSR